MKTSIFKMAAVVTLVSAFVLVARCEASVTEVVNVDFNHTNVTTQASSPTYTGLGAAPDLVGNTKWNGVGIPDGSSGTLTYGSLVASDLSPVPSMGFNLAISNVAAYMYHDNVNPAVAPELMDDFVYDADIRLTITGLNAPNATYALYLYAQDAAADVAVSAFNLDKGGVGTEVATAANDGTNPASFILNNNYVEFDNLTPVSGEISVFWVNNPSQPPYGSYLNGFTVVETIIPEPSTILLFGVGGALLWLRRRIR